MMGATTTAPAATPNHQVQVVQDANATAPAPPAGAPIAITNDQQQQQPMVDLNATANMNMDPANMLAFQQLLFLQQQQHQQQAGAAAAQANMNPFIMQMYANQAGLAAANYQTAPQQQQNATLLGQDAGLQGLSSAASEPVVPAVKLKQAPKKKPKGKPKRPLSSYNIFFKEERARILKEGEKAVDKEEEENKNGHDKKGDGKNGKKRKALPHGKIGFESLAKTIGKRWKALDPDDLVYYQEKAAIDMQRYKREMDTFMTKQREDSEAKMESLAADGEAAKDGGDEDETNMKQEENVAGV
jgi:hypothetical protein